MSSSSTGTDGRPYGTNLDPWYDNYAQRAAGLAASEVRALFAVASRPEVVSLAGGMPYVSALPQDLIVNASSRVMRDYGNVALQYGSGQGMPRLREHIADVMAEEGIQCSIDDIVVTTGSQQGLDLITKLFIDPGDVILAESPSYVGAIGVFRSYQAVIEHVPMDDDGLIPEALEEHIRRVRARGGVIKFLYTIPNFHNPAGVTLSQERRARIVDVCQRNNVLIVEDNPYGLLYFSGPPPQPLRTLDEDGIIYLGSFSKTLAPGFRIGWVLAPHAVREKLVLSAESAILCPSAFAQLVITEYLDNADWRHVVNLFRGEYRVRKDAMISALQEHLPDIRWTNPDGGFYVWATLPEYMDTKSMLPRAVTELVAYTPGTAFFGDGTGSEFMRLSFCYPSPESIHLGIRRLATVINAERDLLSDFAETGPVSSVESNQFSAPPPDVS